jgi:hypothetical protein
VKTDRDLSAAAHFSKAAVYGHSQTQVLGTQHLMHLIISHTRPVCQSMQRCSVAWAEQVPHCESAQDPKLFTYKATIYSCDKRIKCNG